MKKFLIVFLAIILSSFAFADSIGENFDAGGVQIGGSGYYYETSDSYWAFNLNPTVTFYFLDNLYYRTGLDIYLNDYEDNYLDLSLGAGYTFVFSPSATRGSVLAAGFNSYMALPFWENDMTYILTPYLEFLYFLTPRIAPYVTLNLIRLNLISDYDLVSTYLKVSFGISFYMPVKDKVLINQDSSAQSQSSSSSNKQTSSKPDKEPERGSDSNDGLIEVF